MDSEPVLPSPLLTRFLEELPDVFDKEVLSRLDATDRALLARANRACRARVVTCSLSRAVSTSDCINLLITTAFTRSIPLLEWARANGCPWHECICVHAALRGHLEVLKWARVNGCPWGEFTCHAAARGGHLVE